MEIKKTLIGLFSTLFFALFLVQITIAKTHREADQEFVKARLNPNSKIDRSHSLETHSPPKPSNNQEGLKEKDRIDRLPGQPHVGFKQYGGYVTINETAGRAFYYYFTEAHDSHKAKDLPLLLWLNGGPGCSSLAYGAMQELGPFRVASDGKTLYKNKYAWNRAANVLFLESPAGVGFSYSNTTEDFVNGGDRKTASDNYIFLLNWLERFPEYKNRDFYISGESYAGHYVPQLAHNIVYHNQKANKTIINLKGILIGNAVINDETDDKGMYDYFATHALISRETSSKIHKSCDFSPNVNATDECHNILAVADEVFGEVDIYNIYYPRCFNNDLTTIPKRTSILEFDQCSDYYVHAYLNDPNVQKALHANVTKIKYDWEPCSGDVDGRVPLIGSQYSIEAMEIPISNSWRAWYRDGEVGGYVQDYEDNKLTFLTVRGAGHQVPSYRPDRGLSVVSHFITGKPLPIH
ncbi:hypothetical protein ACH5RR_040092 [Cinchona calisaya]|uniref:Carboxypeptidase n=1 Tax=Cinchona calisaya TaxID=153742 RepID=A0ABD2XTR0_9GENT